MRLLLPALAAAAALLLAGCSDPEPGSPLPTGGGEAGSVATTAAPSPTLSAETAEPTAAPSGSATTEPTAAPTAAPTLPPEATTNDAAGAEAFARYWYETLNYAYATGETDPLASASLDECDVCNSYLVDFASLPAGARVDGGQVEVLSATAPAPDRTGNIVVALYTRQEPSAVVAADGSVSDSASGEEIALGAVLSRRDDEWRMYGLGS